MGCAEDPGFGQILTVLIALSEWFKRDHVYFAKLAAQGERCEVAEYMKLRSSE